MKKNKKCDHKTVRALPRALEGDCTKQRPRSQSFTVNPTMKVKVLNSYCRGEN